MIAKRMSPVDIDCFWENVAVRDGECWLWQAGKFTAGYGGFSIDGKVRYAHRIAYELIKGPIPEGAYLLHSCDNPACVNPDHLRAGTQQENIQDAARKGRWMSAKRIAHLGRLHEKQIKHGYSRRDPAKRTPRPVERPPLPVGWKYADEAEIGTRARRIQFDSGSRITGLFVLEEGGDWRSEKPCGLVNGLVVSYRPICKTYP